MSTSPFCRGTAWPSPGHAPALGTSSLCAGPAGLSGESSVELHALPSPDPPDPSDSPELIAHLEAHTALPRLPGTGSRKHLCTHSSWGEHTPGHPDMCAHIGHTRLLLVDPLAAGVQEVGDPPLVMASGSHSAGPRTVFARVPPTVQDLPWTGTGIETATPSPRTHSVSEATWGGLAPDTEATHRHHTRWRTSTLAPDIFHFME